MSYEDLVNPYLVDASIRWEDGYRGRLYFRDREHQTLQHQAVLKHLPDVKGLTVLDYGCGYGDFANCVPGCTYIGVEANPSVATAGRCLYPGLDIRTGRRVYPADVIVAAATVQCGVADPERMIRLFHRHAKIVTVMTVWQYAFETAELLSWCRGSTEVFEPGETGGEDFVTVVMRP